MTQKMDILLSYGKKQINSLIQELCSISIVNARVTTLPLFNQCLEKTVRPNLVKAVDALAIGNQIMSHNQKRSCHSGSQTQEGKLATFLKPSEFFLEMYAYRVQFEDLQQEITFVTGSCVLSFKQI